ncbi:MAG: SPOR domain-containing protein [Desulfovibrio aminophilus]|jgi:cell division protein FtsN|uniref:SPOR domain-containing protein n=1 Tax=Desulfovibrio aminophilus TaxID=81425 RepID=UPI0004257CDD|nr:SPOR domain-containing protein [Desulfovibrio aminophilus]MDY0307619.1 SPOR domain-containing protein [Desulfovibrionaceae bacterium]
MNQMKKVPARKGEPKTYSYTFALPQLVGLGAGLAVALTVFFVLGILIGRGYRPEAEVPELARIMPVPVPANATAPEPQVLKPEELHYMEQLTQTSGAAKGQKAEAPKPEPKPEAKTPAKDDKKTKAEADAKAKADAEAKAKAVEAVRASEKAKVQKAEAQKPKPEAKAPARDQNGEGVFDYVYQAAAFKDRDPAEALRRRIEGTGLKTALETANESSGTWYRVMVIYRGTPSSTDDMREKLRSVGLGRPIMKSKKPAR